MKRNEYKKPIMKVIKLKQRTCLLQGSGDPPDNTGNNPGYGYPAG